MPDPRITAALAEAIHDAAIIESLTGDAPGTDWILLRWAEKLCTMPERAADQAGERKLQSEPD